MKGEFVDTNILIYAHDRSAAEKRIIATDLVTRLVEQGSGLLSTQVLMEFYVAVTRKIPSPITPGKASEIISDFGTWTVFRPEVEDIVHSIRIARANKIHFWDAMIVRASSELEAWVLWTEDLNPGQVYEGVIVRNPFQEESPPPGST